MSNKDEYKSGHRDGRNGFAPHSSNSDYRNGWRNGKQEYDYWNDKELYPSLRHEDSHVHASIVVDDHGVGIGSVFGAIFLWLLIFAPVALFFTWEDWIVQVVFWGGIAVIVLLFVSWIVNVAKAERDKHS